MSTAPHPKGKAECLNPNTGGQMFIDAAIYELFSKTIRQVLEKGQPLTYTQMVKGIKDYFCEKEIAFDKSVEWYTVAIKNDLQTRGLIRVLSVKGKKLHHI